ncbi:hypothetical protein B0H11DRAFT_2017083 [Mycena galericulata]|nr:hypothetical protein B0H11DRAFT_2017083 [Mycena galericulata]
MSLVQTLSRVDTSCSSNVISERSSQRTFTETSTVWGPGTLSGRAILALGGATIRGIDALLIRRKMLAIRRRAPGNLTSSMCNDLLELCRPALYSLRIAKEAIRLTLVQICAGPQLSRCMVAVFLCKWPRQEARLILFELIRFLSTVPPGWELEKFHDFLLAIVQVKERWRSFVAEAVLLLQTTFPPLVNHPAHIMANEVAAGLPESPLSLLQDAYSAHSSLRLDTWMLLQTCGQPLRERMLKIERILLATPDASKAETRDAIVDLGYFMGQIESQSDSGFDFGIRSSALSCLQSIPGTRWENVYEASGLPLEELGTGFALEECTV